MNILELLTLLKSMDFILFEECITLIILFYTFFTFPLVFNDFQVFDGLSVSAGGHRESLSGWLAGWLVRWLTDRLTDWLTYWND